MILRVASLRGLTDHIRLAQCSSSPVCVTTIDANQYIGPACQLDLDLQP